MKMVTKKPVVRKGTAKELKGLEKKIGKVPKFFKELTVNDPDMYNLVMKMEGHVWDDGELTRKTKKLIAIAIAAALRDQHAVRAQLDGGCKSWCHKSRGRRGTPGHVPSLGHACVRVRQGPA